MKRRVRKEEYARVIERRHLICKQELSNFAGEIPFAHKCRCSLETFLSPRCSLFPFRPSEKINKFPRSTDAARTGRGVRAYVRFPNPWGSPECTKNVSSAARVATHIPDKFPGRSRARTAYTQRKRENSGLQARRLEEIAELRESFSSAAAQVFSTAAVAFPS